MSNGPFPEGTQFAPGGEADSVYDSLTDLLSDGYNDSVGVVVWPPNAEGYAQTSRQSIADLQRQYDEWRTQQGIEATADRRDELTVEWGCRARRDPQGWTHRAASEKEARDTVASATDLFELVSRLVTAWEPSE